MKIPVIFILALWQVTTRDVTETVESSTIHHSHVNKTLTFMPLNKSYEYSFAVVYYNTKHIYLHDLIYKSTFENTYE